MAKKSPASASNPKSASSQIPSPAKETFAESKTTLTPPPSYGATASDVETPRLRQAIKMQSLKRPAVLGSESAPKTREVNAASWPFLTGVGLTVAWFAGVAMVAFGASGTVFGFPVTSVALGLSGAVAPPALLWMVIAYLQRASDIRNLTEPLRRQLQMVLGTGAQAENRIRRFNDALERQLELLRQAGDGSYEVLQSAVQILQEEEEAIHLLAERSSKEVSGVASVVRDNSAILEDLLHDNRERFNDLSSRIAGHIATLDDKATEATDRLSQLVDRLHGLIGEFLVTAERKLSTFNGISSQVAAQEKESVEAAERMGAMLASARQGAAELNQILLKNQEVLENSGQSLLARMQAVSSESQAFSAASEEKEQKLAEKSRDLNQTLAREIAALETLTGRLEAQIAAANESLGTRSSDLEEKQSRLTAQAAHLLQGLQGTVQLMEQNAQNAFEKFAGVSEKVQMQSMRAAQQFQVSGDQYDKIAEKLETISQQVASRVASIGENLKSQSTVLADNAEKAITAAGAAQSGVSGTLEKLEVMIARIFDAETKAKASAGEMNQAYTASLEELQKKLENFGAEAARHTSMLAQVEDQFDEAGSRLAERARQTEGTWQSLVAAAERQQEILQQQLRQKIEEATALLNENAVAIEAARDGLHANIEAAFDRAEEIKAELKTLSATVEAPFEEGVRRVQTAVQQGQNQITQFMESLKGNAQQLGAVNEQLLQQEEKAGHKAAETLAGLDAVAARIGAIQHENMQATQDVLLRLSSLAQQLQSRMGDLSTTAETEQARLSEVARQLSLDINGLIHDSQTADTRVRIAANLLSEQAGEVRQRLESQAEAIGGTLDALNVRFASVAEQMQAIDRLNDTGIGGRVDHLSKIVADAAASLEGLGGHIDERARQLSSMQGQLQEGGRVLDQTTQAALDKLSVFTHALISAQTTSGEAAQTVFARLSEMQEQFGRQVAAVNEGSQTITQNMRGAVDALIEQSVALAAASEAAEQKVGGLTGITEGLKETLAQVEAASSGLERHAAAAFDRSEGMAKRFEGISEAAFAQLGAAAEQIAKMADASIAKVEDVNRALTSQAEKVTFAGVHLAEIEAEVRASAERNAERLNQISSETGAKALFAADQLQKQIEALKDEAETMLGRFGTLGQGFVSQSTHITEAASELESSLSRMQEICAILHREGHEASQRINGQTLEFRHEVESALSNLSASGDALQNRGDFAITMVHQMASRFAEATQNLRSQFEAQAQQLQKVSDAARSQLEDFGSRLTSHTDRLDSTAGTLSESGREIGETLEKANFLLRNLSTQTDRVKGGVQEIGGALLQRLSEMLCTFEDELKGLTSNTGFGLDELQRKAESASQQLREEALIASRQIQDVFAGLPKAVEQNFTAAAQYAEQIITQLRAQSHQAAEAVQGGVREVLEGTAAQFEAMQQEFRERLAGTAEGLVGHLRQVQESGSGIMEIMRTGTTAGAEQALQILARLRATAEEEVKTMAVAIGQNLAQIENFSERISAELSSSGDAARNAAMQVFAKVRQGAEQELQAILARAEGTLGELHAACDGLAKDMGQALKDAEGTTQEFGRMATELRKESQRAAASVVEAGQNISATNNLLQRSQGALFEVAQKSNETLHTFNANLAQQVKQVTTLQTVIDRAAQNMGQADERMSVLKQGFETITSELIERLNQGLYSLSRQILSVRKDAETAAQAVGESTQSLAGQSTGVAETASVLVSALNRLEEMSHTLSDSLPIQTQEIEGHATHIALVSQEAGQAVSDLAERMQNQLSYVSEAAEALQVPISQFEALNEQLATALSFASQAAKVPPATAAARPAPATPPSASPRTSTPPRTTTHPPVQSEALREKMQRLAAAAEARTQTAVPGQMQRNSAPRSDNDLVQSLTQIIQQLEETAGSKPQEPDQRNKISK